MNNFELTTDGLWKIKPSGLAFDWSVIPEYVPNKLDMKLPWQIFNYGMSHTERINFLNEHKIVKVFEIIEYFRPPRNDVDATFKGRQYQIARFGNEGDAIKFLLAIG